MRNVMAIAMVICAAGMMHAVAGTTYWKDKDGKITDIPVPGAEKMTVNAPGQDTDAAPASGEKAAADTSTSPEKQAAVRAGQCEQARKQLDTYQQSSAVYEQNDKGERRALTSDERVELILMTQRSVKDFCGETQAAQ